jgi:DNA-binding NtrC family response regulator
VPRAYLAIAQTTGPATILVVEDEMLIRMSTTATLEDAGFLVLEASNSAEALAILSHHGEIRVMLTDVNMPGTMNGLSLVSRVRCDHPAIRSIVMSGHSSALDATNAGATGFLSKPFLNQTMVAPVLDTIKRHLPREKPLAPLH